MKGELDQMTLHYPENVVKIAEILAKNGYKAYAVGGCMRDTLMGRVPNDWDMTTDCSPEKMLEIFDREGVRTIPTGLKHGTVSVLLDGEIYECTTFRIDGSYRDSRHPDKVTFTSDVTEDLRRRDFTVNAIAGDPLSQSGSFVDVFGGKEDIESKVIRAVGDPEKRFTEDALRILRAIRFATVLDFEIDPDTKAAAIKLGNRLADISAERKSVELQKILLSDYADRGISLLLETDLAKYIHPAITSPKVSLSDLSKNFPSRLAALFGQIPDLSCMKLSNETVKQTRLLCNSELYMQTVSRFKDSAACARMLLSVFGELAEDAATLHGDLSRRQTILDERAKNPCLSLRDLAVKGNDLIVIGIEPKCLGELMQKLLYEVIEHPQLNQKELLLAISQKASHSEA